MSNDLVIEYGEEFKSIYSSAKVRNTEVLCAKAVILLPLFVSHSKCDIKEGELISVSIPNEHLVGTGYSEFEYSGLPLNPTSHLDFWKYINALSQKLGRSKITVDVRDMLDSLKRPRKDFHQYDAYFSEFLDRVAHSRVRYRINSKDIRVNDFLVGKTESIGNGIYVVNLGSFMVDSIVNDGHTRKTTIKCPDNISSGNSRLLYEKLDVLIYQHCDTIKIDTLFSAMNFKKRSSAEKDSYFKELNRSISNLTNVGYILKCEKIKGGNTGREIVAMKFVLNKNFNKDLLNGMDDEPFTFDQPSKSLPAVASVRAPMLPSVVLDEQLAKIGAMFDSIGINPEAIEAKAIQAERIEAEKKEKAISSLSSAMARKANKQGMEG